MSYFKSDMVGDILVIAITERRIADELVIRQVQDQLLATLEALKAPKVLLDFGRVECLSSSSLGMLIRVKKKSNDFKGRLKLCSMSKEIRDVFRITGLNRVFGMHRDAKEAIAAFRHGDGPGQAGVLAKLKPRPSGDAAEAELEVEEP
jgi:anti-sigma B factor antagonist